MFHCLTPVYQYISYSLVSPFFRGEPNALFSDGDDLTQTIQATGRVVQRMLYTGYRLPRSWMVWVTENLLELILKPERRIAQAPCVSSRVFHVFSTHSGDQRRRLHAFRERERESH